MKAMDVVDAIESVKEQYGLHWVNTKRISDDWKGRIYEQKSTGIQIGVYNREVAYVRLARKIEGIIGVVERPCTKGDWLKLSQFKDGSGFCFNVADAGSLEQLLDSYFGGKTS